MRLCYAVMRVGEDWKVVSDRRQIGHYQTQESAVVAGARLALEARAAGHEVEFLVQQPSGELTRSDPDQCADASEPLPA